MADGRTVTIRPIRPEDTAPVRDFLRQSSEETRYRHFQRWAHAPSDKLAHFRTDVDYDRYMVLVCDDRRSPNTVDRCRPPGMAWRSVPNQ